MHPETTFKVYKFCENCTRHMHLLCVYILKFGKISAKLSVLGVLYPYCCTDGGEIWQGRVDQGWHLVPSSVPHFTPVGAMCCSCRAKKPQNQPLSNLNTRTLHCMQCCW